MQKRFHAFWSTIFNRDTDQSTLAQILQQIPIFANLSAFELRFILPILHQRHYEAGELVFKEGEAGNGMYIIHTGMVQIFGTDVQGQKVSYAELTAPQFFGELSLVDGQPRSATAEAQEKSILYGFFKPDLLELIKIQPDLGSKILFNLTAILGERLRDTNAKVLSLQNQLQNLRGSDGSRA